LKEIIFETTETHSKDINIISIHPPILFKELIHTLL